MVNTVTMNACIKDFTSPDFGGATGMHVHFDLNIECGELLRDTATPMLIDHKRITGYIRSDGRMYDTPARTAPPNDVKDPGNVGVKLLANDPTLGLEPERGISYTVTFEHLWEGRKQTYRTFSTTVMPSETTTVDLVSYAPGPGMTTVSKPMAWGSIPGQPPVIAAGATQSDARNAIGAGTSNLAIGATATTAKPGNWRPTVADISTSSGTALATTYLRGDGTWAPIVIPPQPQADWNTLANKPNVVAAGADQASARAAIGAGTSNLVLGGSSTTAKPGNYAPTSAEIVSALGYTPGKSNLDIGSTATTAKPGNYTPTSAEISNALGYVPQDPGVKGQSNGYASLDVNGQVPASQLGNGLQLGTSSTTAKPGNWRPAPADISATGTPSATTYLRGDGTWSAAAGPAADWNTLANKPTVIAAGVDQAAARAAIAAGSADAAAKTLTNTTLTAPTINGGTVTNTTLTTPILDRPTITGAATFRDYLPWSTQTGSTVETIGTPGKLSIISGANAGNPTMSSTVNPLLESALADHTFRGGTVTVTINGAAATAGDFTTPIANAFAPNTAPVTIVTKAATDVVVIEVDISPYRTGLFQPQVGYIARLSGSARDVTIEAFDGTSWIASTPITGSNSPVWAVRFGTVAAATKFRWTFTNLAFPTALNIIKLWAIPAWNDSIDGFGGFMTRRGGAMYGNASAPPGFTPSAGVPLRLNVSNADVELASGVPLTSLVAAPASGTAAGRRGQLALAADGNSMLVCVTTGAAGVAVWKRLTLATF